MVTHGVDEVLVLADRVLGRIILDQVVGLPHPWRNTGARFASLRGDLLSALGVVAEV
jgi:ABC-type nitrate/sulfonate/bicarbonate transport system ATPase subunit